MGSIQYFFQNYWSTIGVDVFQCGVAWLDCGCFLSLLNDTNIVLNPKYDCPQTIRDLRHISLCNVLYKIVSKVMSRFKLVLPGLVNKAQSTFVEGRLIQDNVLIAFEALHAMKNKRRVKSGDLALKFDIGKAYDKVDWGFSKSIPLKLGFSEKWTR